MYVLMILKFQLRKSIWKCLQNYTLTRLGRSDAMDFVIIGSGKGMKWDGCESSYQDQVVNTFFVTVPLKRLGAQWCSVMNRVVGQITIYLSMVSSCRKVFLIVVHIFKGDVLPERKWKLMCQVNVCKWALDPNFYPKYLYLNNIPWTKWPPLCRRHFKMHFY